jgi:2-keto-4-pentenoate hydratase
VHSRGAGNSPEANVHTIARAFVEARRAGTALPEYPGTIPATLAEAYAVQDAALTLDGRQVQGWKVGRINPPREGFDRLAGPIFADQVPRAESGASIDMPVFGGGFAAAEAEFLFRLGDVPAGQLSFTYDEAATAVDAVHVGIEVASSPFPGINVLGPTVTISDFGNNNGLVIGPEVTDWQAARLNDWPIELRINGAVIGFGTAAAMLDGPLGAVRFLLEHAATRGLALAPGTWISSGAVTGVHECKVGDRIEARFGDGLITRCTITGR